MDAKEFKDVRGIWKTRGYSMIFEFTRDSFKEYEYCQAGCLYQKPVNCRSGESI